MAFFKSKTSPKLDKEPPPYQPNSKYLKQLQMEKEEAERKERERIAKEEEEERARKREEQLSRQNEKSLALARAMREKTEAAAAELERQHQELLERQRQAEMDRRGKLTEERRKSEQMAEEKRLALEKEEKRKQQEQEEERRVRALRLQDKVQAQKTADILAEQRWLRHQVEKALLKIAKTKKGVVVSYAPDADPETKGTPIDAKIHVALLDEFFPEINAPPPSPVAATSPTSTSAPKARWQPRFSAPVPPAKDSEQAKVAPPSGRKFTVTVPPPLNAPRNQRPSIFTPAHAAEALKSATSTATQGGESQPPSPSKKFVDMSLSPEPSADDHADERDQNDNVGVPPSEPQDDEQMLASAPEPVAETGNAINEEEREEVLEPKSVSLPAEEMLRAVTAVQEETYSYANKTLPRDREANSMSAASRGSIIAGAVAPPPPPVPLDEDEDQEVYGKMGAAQSLAASAVSARAQPVYGDDEEQYGASPPKATAASGGELIYGDEEAGGELIYGDEEAGGKGGGKGRAVPLVVAAVQPLYNNDDAE